MDAQLTRYSRGQEGLFLHVALFICYEDSYGNTYSNIVANERTNMQYTTTCTAVHIHTRCVDYYTETEL